MKQLDLEKAGYKYFKSVLYPNAKALYQKKCRDGEYFINCIVYEDDITNGGNNYMFEVQFEYNNRAVNLETVQWFNDVDEKYRPYPTIEEVEKMIDKIYLAYINNNMKEKDLENILKNLEKRNNINYYDEFIDKNEGVRQLYYDRGQIDLLRDILSIKK